MRLAALTLALVTAAAAARAAGTKNGDFSISGITYDADDSDSGARLDTEVKTEICADSNTVLGSEISYIKIQIAIDQEVLPYEATKFSQDQKCVIFSAPKPGNGKNVLYTLEVITPIGRNKAAEQKAFVTFKFQEKENQDQITCGGTFFKKTTKESDVCPGETNGANCYETTDTFMDAQGCVTPPTLQQFQYCQEKPSGDVTITSYASSGDSGAESLAYGNPDGILTLGVNAGENGDDVIVMDSSTPDSFKVVTLKVPGNGNKRNAGPKDGEKGSVTLKDFSPSDALYTACPVHADFTEYTINDLFILGTYEQVPPSTGEFYYEFGLQHIDTDDKKYVASTSSKPIDESDIVATTMTINCANLEVGQRCYGYVKDDGGKDNPNPLTVSYKKADNTLNIIVGEALIPDID